jgi:hypothetical protein
MVMRATDIREHMEVYGSCGKRVGSVECVEGRSIKLTKDSPAARGEHRYIPLAWVASIDEAVRLSKPGGDVREEWQAHPFEEGEGFPE